MKVFLSNLRKGHDVDDTEKIEKDCLAAVHDKSEVNDFKWSLYDDDGASAIIISGSLEFSNWWVFSTLPTPLQFHEEVNRCCAILSR